MSTRTDLAHFLTANIPPAWRVIPYADEPILSTTTLMTYVEKVEPGTVLGASRSYTVAVLVMTAKQVAPEDVLEEALDEVLGLLEEYPFTLWTTAERSVSFETYPSYKITALIHTYEQPDESEED